MQLCVACCATLDATPTHSEKPEAPPKAFPCGHSICGACQRKRRSLGQACILCTTAGDLLSPAATPRSATPSASVKPPAYAAPPRDIPDGDFVLGDDSDDEDGEKEPLTPPPEVEWGEPPAYEGDGVERKMDAKVEREQSTLHYIKPEETLAGLALQYQVPGHLLCTMNKLPVSTLSTTPHLLHTLPFLLLPPGSRPSTSTEPLLPAPLERRRLVVRRFQMATKCAESAMAQAYVDAVFKAREDEARFVGENRRARGETDADVEPREGGELEEAVEAYQRDERWEREQAAMGKGKGVFRPIPAEQGKPRKGWWR
ncbi:hypothetical protein JCM10207_007892 [Rhodosporidiobolus poonsookiae]